MIYCNGLIQHRMRHLWMIFPEWYLSILLSGYDFVLYTIVIKSVIYFLFLKDFIVSLDYMLRILMFLCFHFLHFYILPFVIFFPLNSTSLFPLCYLHISLKTFVLSVRYSFIPTPTHALSSLLHDFLSSI